MPDGLLEADVVIEGGRIAAVGRYHGRSGDQILDARGQLVLPGMIDVHTHLEIPLDGLVPTDGLTSSDDFTSGTTAAVAGGTTSIIDFAIQQPGMSLSAALDLWLTKLSANPPLVDVGLHMMLMEIHSDEAERELIEIAARGVTSFKLFMAYKGWIVDEETIFRTARAAAACGAVVMVHAESGEVIEVLIADAVKNGEGTMEWHAHTRPPETEAAAIAQAIAICEMAGAPVYIVHVSSQLGADEIARARARGARVWAETCPQYLTFTEDALHQAPEDAAKFVFTPPPRSTADRAHLWRSLEEDVLSVVSTDHCPYPLSEKLGRRFDQVPQGAPGIGGRLAVMFDGVADGRITLDTLVKVCAHNPARLFGMWPRKGDVAVGSDADVILFDPSGETVISAATAHSNADHSLYEQMRFPGAVRAVLVGGRTVFEDGVVTAPEASHGYLPRKGWAEGQSSTP